MPETDFDMIVLGVGAMGSATLYELTRRGYHVCGIEQFGIAHDQGSSHGDTRIMRKAYFEHPDYMPLLDRSYELWAALEEASGEELFVEHDLIIGGPANSKIVLGLEECYGRHSLPHERLTGAAAHTRFPQIHFPENSVVYLDPVAGFLRVEQCIETYVKAALALGATVLTNERVSSWTSLNGKIEVTTPVRRLSADKLALTAGAWTSRILAGLNIELQVWRKPVVWYKTTEMAPYEQGVFPIFYFATRYGDFYGFPSICGQGLKIGEHLQPELCRDPDALTRTVGDADERSFIRFIRETFDRFEPHRTRASVCMYTMTRDGHFVTDLHPRYKNVVLASGFCGHGFKFAPVVGEILSDLMLQGHSTHPIGFLNLNRLNI